MISTFLSLYLALVSASGPWKLRLYTSELTSLVDEDLAGMYYKLQCTDEDGDVTTFKSDDDGVEINHFDIDEYEILKDDQVWAISTEDDYFESCNFYIMEDKWSGDETWGVAYLGENWFDFLDDNFHHDPQRELYFYNPDSDDDTRFHLIYQASITEEE
eukprot:695122_1